MSKVSGAAVEVISLLLPAPLNYRPPVLLPPGAAIVPPGLFFLVRETVALLCVVAERRGSEAPWFGRMTNNPTKDRPIMRAIE